MKHLKFRSKIYLVSFIVIVSFVISAVVLQSKMNTIVDNIEILKDDNKNLQSVLLLLSNIEKLKRNVLEYQLNADDSNKKIVEEIFEQTLNEEFKIQLSNKTLETYYIKILENLQRYFENFEIDKKQVPLNIALKVKLRNDAQAIENLVTNVKIAHSNYDMTVNFILLRKYILEVEKGVVRYFETNQKKYIKYANLKLSMASDLIVKIQNSPKSKFTQEIQDIKLALKNFRQNVRKTINKHRNSMMHQKIVMAGDVYEISVYSKKLKISTVEKIELTNQKLEYYIESITKMTQVVSFIYILLLTFSFWFIIRIFFKPLQELTKMFENLSMGKENIQIPEYQQNDEIGKLINAAKSFEGKNKEAKNLLLQMKDYQTNLENKVESEIKKRQEQEKALIQQSKLASMGEMIGAIAHQWRQPLNELTIRIQKLKYSYLKDEIDEDFIQEFIAKNKNTIDFMSKTIDDFRNFFRIDKEKLDFDVKEALEEIISIQTAQLKNHNITISIEGENFSLLGYKSEFQQVIINIINNSKDAFSEHSTKENHIFIKLDNKAITIKDNAGGIPQEVIERVFEPYFTTKDQGKGTGLGMYMSKMIIEDNMNAKLSIENEDEGAKVTLNFNQNA